MSNKYLVKLAGMASLLGKARGMASSAGASITRNARSLADDAKTMVNPTNRFGQKVKSRVEAAKSMARNPVAQAGAATLAVGGIAATRRKDD